MKHYPFSVKLARVLSKNATGDRDPSGTNSISKKVKARVIWLSDPTGKGKGALPLRPGCPGAEAAGRDRGGRAQLCTALLHSPR